MKKIFSILLLLMLSFAAFFTGGCYYDNLEELHPELLLNNSSCDTTVVISFVNDIQPILQSNCGSNNSCHQIGNGGVVELQDYAGVKAIAASGKLIGSITWNGSASQMPLGSAAKISDCYLGKIQKWIDQNAPNN